MFHRGTPRETDSGMQNLKPQQERVRQRVVGRLRASLAQGTGIAQSPLLSNAYHIMQLTLILWGCVGTGGCGHTLLQCLLRDALAETELAPQSRELL